MAQERVAKSLVSVEFLPDSQTPVVTSLQLAEHFGIRHHHVIRDIKAIANKVPESFAATNFGFSKYSDSTGRELPAYTLTRDGFTLLAMGYNSPRAIAWKLRYIEAFNALEAAVLEGAKKEAYLEGAKDRAWIERDPARLELAKKIAAYRAKGLKFWEIGKILDIPRRTANEIACRGGVLALEEGI